MTTTCVLCGGEIPAGWPIVALPAGLAHRFNSMCDVPAEAEAQACRLLEANGQRLGIDFAFDDAATRAGALILDPGAKAA
jgi:hypothetical protein